MYTVHKFLLLEINQSIGFLYVNCYSFGDHFNSVNEAVFFLPSLKVKTQNFLICFIYQNRDSPGPHPLP